MFKVGDIVKIKDAAKIFYWYNFDLYKITSINGELCELYNLNINEFDDDLINVGHLCYAIKEYRKMKLEKICLNQEIK